MKTGALPLESALRKEAEMAKNWIRVGRFETTAGLIAVIEHVSVSNGSTYGFGYVEGLANWPKPAIWVSCGAVGAEVVTRAGDYLDIDFSDPEVVLQQEPEEVLPFGAGDLARHKAGGPIMCVERVYKEEDGNVYVQASRDSSELGTERLTYLATVLEKYEAPKVDYSLSPMDKWTKEWPLWQECQPQCSGDKEGGCQCESEQEDT